MANNLVYFTVGNNFHGTSLWSGHEIGYLNYMELLQAMAWTISEALTDKK
jgi:hypothetical protein